MAAPPDVIVFGGGWGPEGTQASIEAHVGALAKALQKAEPEVLFAGDADRPAVQIRGERDEVSALLGLVFDRRDHLDVRYRAKKVGSKAASKRGLLAAIDAAKGPLILLGAGHGAPGTEEQEAALELWGPADRLSVSELKKALDQKKHPVAVVLGHCHSGAFANLMYARAQDRTLSRPARCVLAAVPADRQAAGCTPDLDDASAQAYMALIAQAFQQGRDLDGDGQVSLAEAHAHARIHDPTVDVPVSSSELYLLARLGDRTPRPEKIRLGRILARASPVERAVLERMEEGRLKKRGLAWVSREVRRLDDRIDDISAAVEKRLKRRDQTRKRLVDAVLQRWPELVNPYHHRARQLLAAPEAIVGFVRDRDEHAELLRLDAEITERDEEIWRLEKRAARLERFVRAAQVVAGERLLSRRERRAYRTLTACEAMKPLAR